MNLFISTVSGSLYAVIGDTVHVFRTTDHPLGRTETITGATVAIVPTSDGGVRAIISSVDQTVHTSRILDVQAHPAPCANVGSDGVLTYEPVRWSAGVWHVHCSACDEQWSTIDGPVGLPQTV